MRINTEHIYRLLRSLAAHLESDDFEAALAAYHQIKELDDFSLEMFIAIYERRLLPLKQRFIEVNNRHVLQTVGTRPDNILLLLPFCLQSTLCKHRVIWNIANCKECGLCPVGHIKGLAEKHEFTVRMAERGVMAKDILRAENPDLTIAVACTDELFEGIVRCNKSLVYAVPNTITEQYCINTTVAPEAVTAALELFIKPEDRPCP